MAICTKCGAILNDADITNGVIHTCNPLHIPAPGKVKNPTTTETDAEEAG